MIPLVSRNNRLHFVLSLKVQKIQQNLNNPHTFPHSLLPKTCPESEFRKFWTDEMQVKEFQFLSLHLSVHASKYLITE